MPQVARFFVQFYRAGSNGDFVLADRLELPSEDSAIHAAKLGSMKHAGTAAIAVSAEDAGEGTVLRTYGGMPGSAGGRAMGVAG